MRVVWLDGERVEPARAALSIDDPGVRWGEGLFETMRAERGRVALLERHLDRLIASATALGLAPMPTRPAMRADVRAALDASGPGPLRVRLSATPHPTLLIETSPVAELAAEVPGASAATVPGAWSAGNRIAEHKCLSYAAHRWSQRRAEAAGADHALLLDEHGRLGEAALGSVFCVIAGTLMTAPASGLLAGVARSVVQQAMAVREEVLEESVWRSADEIVLTNAVGGAVALVAVDGASVGGGGVGPMARSIADALRAALGGSA